MLITKPIKKVQGKQFVINYLNFYNVERSLTTGEDDFIFDTKKKLLCKA